MMKMMERLRSKAPISKESYATRNELYTYSSYSLLL
jgi:hypothetical protein